MWEEYNIMDLNPKRNPYEMTLKEQVAREQALPHNTDGIPNKETLLAMKEVEYLKAHPDAGRRYTDVDKMIEDLINTMS